MENHAGSPDGGVLVPVSTSSDLFRNNILAPLRSAYLHQDSQQRFTYISAFLVKNPSLEEKYHSARAKITAEGYTEEDLEECFGFLLFDDADKAKTLCQTGVLTGNSASTGHGEPSNGIYISLYSDCLDLNCLYNGKSGHIVIIKLTKCYLYELPKDGHEASEASSLVCPFAIVSFSYTSRTSEATEESAKKTTVGHHSPWRCQLQLGSHSLDVGLRPTSGIVIPTKLPTVVKADRAVSMLDLKRLLPKEIFADDFFGRVSVEGMHYSLHELVPSATEDTRVVSLLARELKKKELALTVPLNDGGFFVLLHSSHFLTFNDIRSNETDRLNGMFVFPESEVIARDTKIGQRKPAISSEIQRVLPALNYAQGEVEKTPIRPTEKLCEIVAQHLQSYAALIDPGLDKNPSWDNSTSPDKLSDLPDTSELLCADQKWTNRTWQGLESYLKQPDSFQLPVSRASKIMGAELDKQSQDLHSEVFVGRSYPKEGTNSPASAEVKCQESRAYIGTIVDKHISSLEEDSTVLPQKEGGSSSPAADVSKQIKMPHPTVLSKADGCVLDSFASADQAAELIVSITSAERTAGVAEKRLDVIGAKSATTHDDIQISDLSLTKFERAHVNSLNIENDEVPRQNRCCKGFNKIPGDSIHASVDNDNFMQEKCDQDRRTSGHLDFSETSNTALRTLGNVPAKMRRIESSGGKLMRKRTLGGASCMERIPSNEVDAFPTRKKAEHWGLQPLHTKCGRLLVPYGSADLHLSKEEPTKDDVLMSAECPVNPPDRTGVEQERSTVLETTKEETSEDVLPSVDTHFALALGLTPKDPSDGLRKSVERDLDLSRDIAKMQKVIFHKRHQLHGTQRSPSVLLRKSRLKTLRKRQDISAECVKKKWWLHFQSPASTAKEVQNKNGTSSSAGKRSPFKKSSPACSSADALNLLADLALGANNKQQHGRTLEKSSDSESCDHAEDISVGIVDKESALNTLLTQPALERMSSHECPSTKGHGDTIGEDLIRLISIDHPYSCPPLLGLIGTPFQAPSVSASSNSQHHHQTLHNGVIQTLTQTENQEDGRPLYHRTTEYLKKKLVKRRKFQHSRQFVNKAGTIYVTRVWKEKYDFGLDSKFANDLSGKTINRALHGPWDCCTPESSKEIELIFHMWIGLFYSRSTSRQFYFDPSFKDLFSKDPETVEFSAEMVPAQDDSNVETNESDPSPPISSHNSISQALDLRMKHAPNSSKISKTLDPTPRRPVEQVAAAASGVTKPIVGPHERTDDTETSDTPKPSLRDCERRTLLMRLFTAFQCYREIPDMLPSNEDGRDKSIDGTTSTSSTVTSEYLENADPVSLTTDECLTSLTEEFAKLDFQREKAPTSPETHHSSHGPSNGTASVEHSVENPQSSESEAGAGTESSKAVAEESANIQSAANIALESKEEESGGETISPKSLKLEEEAPFFTGENLNENLETGGTVIPFIGVALSWGDGCLPQFSPPHGKVEETTQSPDRTSSPCSSEDIVLTVMPQISQAKSDKDKVCDELESNDRCSTPIVDEIQYEQSPRSDPFEGTPAHRAGSSSEESGSRHTRGSEKCLQNDSIVESVKQERLIFSEKFNQLLRKERLSCTHSPDRCDGSDAPLSVQSSDGGDQMDTLGSLEFRPLSMGKISQNIPECLPDAVKEAKTQNSDGSKSPKHARLSAITSECAMEYNTMMDDICTSRTHLSRSKSSQGETAHQKPTDPTRHRFFILETSNNIIFNETRARLEADGHAAVQPSQFFHSADDASSLLIILRNEDIATHICEIPHLLELKMRPSVLFAGIDEPDDVTQLTYQEVFARGGILTFDRAALQSLSTRKMKKIMEIVQQLNTRGRWRWLWHYRDSRWLKESARLNSEAKRNRDLLSHWFERGIADILPYHECDLKSSNQPNYLSCLVHLQVQHISARYAVFVTDTTDDTFGRNGILTMNVKSFLAVSLHDRFPV